MSVYVWIHALKCRCSQKSEVSRPSGASVIGGCALCDMGAENLRVGLLPEQ